MPTWLVAVFTSATCEHVRRRRPQGRRAGQRRRRRDGGRVPDDQRTSTPATPSTPCRSWSSPIGPAWCGAASSARCRRRTCGRPWRRLATRSEPSRLVCGVARGRRPGRPSIASRGFVMGARAVGRRRGDDVRGVAALARRAAVVLGLLHPARHGGDARRRARGDRCRWPTSRPGSAGCPTAADRGVDEGPPAAAAGGVRRAGAPRRPVGHRHRARQRHGRRRRRHRPTSATSGST